MKPAGDWIQ